MKRILKKECEISCEDVPSVRAYLEEYGFNMELRRQGRGSQTFWIYGQPYHHSRSIREDRYIFDLTLNPTDIEGYPIAIARWSEPYKGKIKFSKQMIYTHFLNSDSQKMSAQGNKRKSRKSWRRLVKVSKKFVSQKSQIKN